VEVISTARPNRRQRRQGAQYRSLIWHEKLKTMSLLWHAAEKPTQADLDAHRERVLGAVLLVSDAMGSA
jgi:hypothetical protein